VSRAANPSRWCSPPATAVTAPSSCRCSPRSGFPAPGPDAPHPPDPRAPTAPTCAAATSQRPFRSRPTRPRTESSAVLAAGGHRCSTRSPTETATPWNRSCHTDVPIGNRQCSEWGGGGSQPDHSIGFTCHVR
jgi:hypothetical protein